MSKSESGPTPQEILEEARRGAGAEGAQVKVDRSSESARKAIQEFYDDHLGAEALVQSRDILEATEPDPTLSEIGNALRVIADPEIECEWAPDDLEVEDSEMWASRWQLTTDTTRLIPDREAYTCENQHRDTSTPRARRALERYCTEFVRDRRIVNVSSIRSALRTDVSLNELGHALRASADGDREEWPPNVSIERWSDTDPIKWELTRTGGEPPGRGADRPWRKYDLVREIDRELPVEDATRDDSDENCDRIRVTWPWMHAAVEAVADRAGESFDDEDEPDLEEATKRGLSEILERLLDIEIVSRTTCWDKRVYEVLWDVLVAGVPVEEVTDCA